MMFRHDTRAAAFTALACLAACAGAAPLTVTVIDAGGAPLADAVVSVYLKGAHTRAEPGKATAELGQRSRQFTPQVLAIQTGTAVNFPNFDTVRHHVYSFSPTKTFELKLYAGTPANPVLFDKPGIAVLGCNIHDSMVAWVVVVETPYHGQADAQGVLKLDNVPPGSYRLRSWHAGLPPGTAALDEALVVAPNGTSAVVKLPLAGSAL